jgi:hypothetical protein
MRSALSKGANKVDAFHPLSRGRREKYKYLVIPRDIGYWWESQKERAH